MIMELRWGKGKLDGAAHGRGRLLELLGGIRWSKKWPESGPVTQPCETQRACLAVVVVSGRGGRGVGGAEGSRWWRWLIRKWPEIC